jgi:predicted DNA-binding transcriptional regulator AlpA
VARINLTSADARVIADLLLEAADPGSGSGPRGPIGLWIGSAAVASRVGVQASTIRGWVAHNGPKKHPFPSPERYRGRNYWQKTAIDQWNAEERRLDERRRASSSGSRPRSPFAVRRPVAGSR